MPNHCEPAAGTTRTRASPTLTCAPTASLNRNSAFGSVPWTSRNRANCRSSAGNSAGVKPHRFIDTISLPSSVTVSPASDGVGHVVRRPAISAHSVLRVVLRDVLVHATGRVESPVRGILFHDLNLDAL